MRSLRLFLLLLVGLAVPFASADAQRRTVIDDDFEDYDVSDPALLPVYPEGANGIGQGASATRGLPSVGEHVCLADELAVNQVMLLTDGENDERSWIWFEEQFDLAQKRVEIDFDLFIGRGASATPADGVSVIFQFDNDLNATGGGGGALGTGNFRGNNSEHIAVGLDIWDNGGADPETPVDGRYGGPSTANIEVNQNNPNPGNTASLANSTSSPDFIASADIYDSTCDEGDLVHIRIVFDNQLVIVTTSGPAGDVDPAVLFEEQIVISESTAPFPERLSNIGFAASTGGANAVQWIDNLLVVEDDSRVSIVQEDPLTEGAMNLGGPALDATGEIRTSFRADAPVGGEVSRETTPEEIIITTSVFGRINNGSDFTFDNAAASIDASQIAGAGAITEQVLDTGAWSEIGVNYQATVIPGRYAVDLYFADDCNCAVNAAGQGTRLIDARLNGETGLSFWSAAAAAGSADGSGSPLETCVAVLNTGIRRSFEVDVADSGDGTGLLDILIADLGGGNPPENAALNALSFRRVSDATGAPISGDIELFSGGDVEDPAGILIETDFEDDLVGECPAGMNCNTNAFVPQVVTGLVDVDQRLRIVDDATGSTGSSAFFSQTVNVADFSLTASFDLFMENPDAGTPADGVTFAVVEGNDPTIVGGGGGAMGIPGGSGFVVEFDCWQSGGASGGSDSSGFNSADAWTHVGINNLSQVSSVTNRSFNPDLIPVAAGGTGWPNFFDPDGVSVRIEYRGGTVTVTLEGVTAELEPFGPTIVAQADIFPLQSSEAVVGFTGGTGGATIHGDVDNVVIVAAPGEPGGNAISAALEEAANLWDGGNGALYINAGGPALICSGTSNPAPFAIAALGAGGGPDVGDPVVWVPDQAGGGGGANDFFAITPLDNDDGTPNNLGTAFTNMGRWDARGTERGVDDNDAVFHWERFVDLQYDIPVQAGNTYEVTLYFANSFSGTAGSGQRFFHVLVNGDELEGFEHCDASILEPNVLDGFDNLFDPVEAGELIYGGGDGGAAVCANQPCEPNGVTVMDDPDIDGITADLECGNAAAVAIRVLVPNAGDILSIALTDPSFASGEPLSPDPNPKISGIAIRSTGSRPGVRIAQTDGGTAVSEDGATDTYSIALRTQPSADVTIALDGGEQVTATSRGSRSVTFTTENWNEPQIVEVAAVDDNVDEDDIHAGAVSHTVTSDDADYNGVEVADVPVAITDNDDAPMGVAFIRGDTNNDGAINLSDGVNVLNVLFLGIGAIPCAAAGDTNADGATNLSDGVNVLNVLFLGIGSIPAPNACGDEPLAADADACAETTCAP